MLQTIREHTQGWIASVIIGIIILTFALWGIHSYFTGGGTNNVIAEVNGKNITKEQLTLAYERLRRQMQSTNSPLQNDAAIKDLALQKLVELEVLKQASYVEGFRIYDAQIDNYLQSIPEFQVNGQFSLDRFEHVLSASLLSTNEFLNLIKSSLQIEQPKLGVIFSSFALPDETAENIAIVNQERDIQYMLLPLSYFLAQPFSVPEQQIQNYYDEHKHEFMTNEQISIEYLELSVENLAETIHPTEAELKNFYNENISSYSVAAGKNKEATPQKYDLVKEKVKESYVMQHAEEKFADVREQLSNMTYEHPDSLQYAAKTLNLPIKTSELFVKDVAGKDISQYKNVRDAAFSNDVLKLKNNSDVIQINSKTAIVLRDKTHIPAMLIPLKSVSTQIEEKLKHSEAWKRGEAIARGLRERLQNGSNPKDILEFNKFSWKDAGFVSRNNNSINTAILQLAFSLPVPQVTHQTSTSGKTKVNYGVAKLPDGFAVVGVKQVKAGTITDQKQNTVFAEQVQNSEGLLEYELYKFSKLKQAEIKS